MTRPIRAAEFAIPAPTIDNCWKRIGVHGDKTCPELAGLAHCHNCPAFSLAAAAMLDREPAQDLESASSGRIVQAAEAGDAETESVLVFRLGTEWFALPTVVFDEILHLRPVHSLPHRRNPALLGLVNVRGELVVCVSIAQLLTGSPQAAATAKSRLAVVRRAGGRFAFPVDGVEGTLSHSREALQQPPATIARSPTAITSGLLTCDDKSIGRLDEGLLFDALDRSLT